VELRDFSQRIATKDEKHLPFSEPKLILVRRVFAERNLEIIEKYVDVLGELAERCKTFEAHDGARISEAELMARPNQIANGDTVYT